MPRSYQRASGLIQRRSAGGRFRRSTLADFGLNVQVHEYRMNGEWCGAINSAPFGEPTLTHCRKCGEQIARPVQA